MARDFDRKVAELQVRVAVLNSYIALGIPITKLIGQFRPRKGNVRVSPVLRNRFRYKLIRNALNMIASLDGYFLPRINGP